MALHPTFQRIFEGFGMITPTHGGIHVIDGRRIRTAFDYPPIPVRNFDWSAVDDNTYDGAEDSKPPANLVGRGTSEAEAIADLLDQLSDQEA